MKKYKLPKEFAEKWIAALRSGEYKQGHSMLARQLVGGTCYCCLGIACVVSGYEYDAIVGSWWIEADRHPLAPKEITGDGGDNELVHNLHKMNDQYNSTFPEIAEWIEANCELY
jgi:hypothetical protein